MAKVLAFGAHPDDIEYYAGGTLAQMISSGDEVVYVIATDGRNGSHDGIKPQQMIQIRYQEQQQAALEMGVKKVIYLGFKDGDLEHHIKQFKKRLLEILLAEKPEVIFSFDPYKQYMVHHDFHPDHRSIAVAVLDLVLIDITLPAKVKTPLKTPQIFLYNSHRANTKIDISKYLSKKKKALQMFHSQSLKIKDTCFEKFRVYTSR